MTTGVMKVEEILQYAIQIENESMKFYRDAVEIVKDESVKSLVVELEMEEVKHEARLEDLLKSVKGMEAPGFEKNSLEQLIVNREIPAEASEVDVLSIALEREKNTRDFYRRVSMITNLESNVIDVFEKLFEQESGHVTRIYKKLEKM